MEIQKQLLSRATADVSHESKLLLPSWPFVCWSSVTDFTALYMQRIPWQQSSHLGSCFPSSLCIQVLNYITGREDTSLPAIITLNEYSWWYFKSMSRKGHWILRRHYYVWLFWRIFLPFIPEENVPQQNWSPTRLSHPCRSGLCFLCPVLFQGPNCPEMPLIFCLILSYYLSYYPSH